MLFQILLEIFLISILPISLIRFKILPRKFRLVLLAFVFLGVVALVFVHGLSFNQLGMRLDTFYSAMAVYVVAALAAILFLRFLGRKMKNTFATSWHQDPHFLFLFIPISIAQQFLFQGFILSRLQAVIPATAAILVTALIFGYVHTIYPRPLFSFFLGLVAGLFFAILYTLYPNLIASSIAHAVLNFTAVYCGFFTFTDQRGHPRKTELHLR